MNSLRVQISAILVCERIWEKEGGQFCNTMVLPKHRHVRRDNNLNSGRSIHPSSDPSLGEILAIQSDCKREIHISLIPAILKWVRIKLNAPSLISLSMHHITTLLNNKKCVSDVTMNKCKYQRKKQLNYLPHVRPDFVVYVLEFIKVSYLTAIIFDYMLISNCRKKKTPSNYKEIYSPENKWL